MTGTHVSPGEEAKARPGARVAAICALCLLALLADVAEARRDGHRVLPSAEEIAMLPPDGGPEFNRLVHEKSPYLRQHARNPVDWHPWGDEAFEKAKREGKPVFLSIGYSSCHWCHVMERESFEDKEVARLLNAGFVSIKVDREERPDVDGVYMKAVQLLTGRGGWPLSAFLTPDRRPFFGGTYFPPEDTGGRAGLKTLLAHVAKIYRTRRDEVDEAAGRLAAAVKLSSAARGGTPSAALDREPVGWVLEELGSRFDERLGGFGRAPKFPPHGSLRLLLYEYGRTKDGPLLGIATRTLDAMAAGGIRDHLGGGFHRYSTDAHWLLPHFEKMLYDNAQLSRIYVRAHLLTGSDEYRRVAVDTYEWVLREMTGAEGGFFSALDADSEGEEGRFYVWRRDEIIAALGEKEGEVFSRAYGVEEEGNYRDQATGERPGTNVLHLARPVAELARELGRDPTELRTALRKARAKLLRLRGKRVRPGLDDKIIAGWNGLMIGSLAYGGRRLDEPRYVRAAGKAARFVLEAMRRDGKLLRAYRDGTAGPGAFLDDYAFLADGLLDLHEATREKAWLDEARSLAEAMTERFADDEAGGFFFTPDGHETLLARSKDPYDKATPSGNAVAARVLVRLGRLTGEGRYAEAARKTFVAFRGHMERAPRAAESLVHALALHLDGAADAMASSGPVTAEAYLSASRVAPGGEAGLAIRLTIDDGWHVNSSSPGRGDLVATSVALASEAAVKLGRVDYPQGRKATPGSSGGPPSIYEGTVWIRSSITALGPQRSKALRSRVAQRSESGAVSKIAVVLVVRLQPCSDRECLAPATLSLPLELRIVDSTGTEATRHEDVFRLLEARKGAVMKERKGLVTKGGRPVALVGREVTVGDRAPAFTALDNDLRPAGLADYKGKILVLVSVPSLDTPVCDIEARRFNEEAAKLGDDVAVLVISMDLPFAQERWCGAAGADKVTTLSDHRDASFGSAYGLLIEELRLLARAVLVVDREGVIRYMETVRELGSEPDYEAALAAVRKLL